MYPLITLFSEHWDGPWFWPIFPLLWIVVLVVLFRLVVWRRWGGRRCGGDSGRDLLRARYARGEISDDEYRERLRTLEER
jgi:putative membrane protein